MRKLRILHLIKSLNRGGAETLLAEGMRFADRERFELSYGYFNPALDALVPTLASSGANVMCFGGHNHVSMLWQTSRVARYLLDERVDLVHCHLPTAAVVGRLAARMAGVPVVYTEHNKPEWYRRPTFLLNKWTYGLQAQVIAVSDSVAQSIRTYIRPRVRVTVVRNGIDATHFHRVADDGRCVRSRLGIAADAVVVGNVAALIPQKRLHDWIEAARIIHQRHPLTRFLLIGEGPLREELKRGIDDAGLQGSVHLCGMQSDVRPYLAAMDIYMMSSAFEGLPVALLEAMAMECVPVCTAVGGIAEVIHDARDGFLTEPGRPEQLAAKVEELLDDPARIRSVAALARGVVERNFDIERMIRELEVIYLTTLFGPPSHPHGVLYPQVTREPARASSSRRNGFGWSRFSDQ